MTYREAFDATGRPRQQPSVRRRQVRVLVRWMGACALVMAWALLIDAIK